jgi:hypothetical protein
MQTVVIIVMCLHLLTAIFWAGTTFTLARTGGAGAERLFRPQMGAATIALLAGVYLWTTFHPSGASATVLGIGALAAIAAAGVQGALGARAIRAVRSNELSEIDGRVRIVLAQRIAAALLVVTIICMVVARYV